MIMTDYLCCSDELITFINTIDFKFSYGLITVNLMDHFPLLKQGKSTYKTRENIFYIYMVLEVIKNNELKFNPERRILGQPIDYSFEPHLLPSVIKENMHLLGDKMDDFKQEELLSIEFVDTIILWIKNTDIKTITDTYRHALPETIVCNLTTTNSLFLNNIT